MKVSLVLVVSDAKMECQNDLQPLICWLLGQILCWWGKRQFN